MERTHSSSSGSEPWAHVVLRPLPATGERCSGPRPPRDEGPRPRPSGFWARWHAANARTQERRQGGAKGGNRAENTRSPTTLPKKGLASHDEKTFFPLVSSLRHGVGSWGPRTRTTVDRHPKSRTPEHTRARGLVLRPPCPSILDFRRIDAGEGHDFPGDESAGWAFPLVSWWAATTVDEGGSPLASVSVENQNWAVRPMTRPRRTDHNNKLAAVLKSFWGLYPWIGASVSEQSSRAANQTRPNQATDEKTELRSEEGYGTESQTGGRYPWPTGKGSGRAMVHVHVHVMPLAWPYYPSSPLGGALYHLRGASFVHHVRTRTLTTFEVQEKQRQIFTYYHSPSRSLHATPWFLRNVENLAVLYFSPAYIALDFSPVLHYLASWPSATATSVD
ncbi:hypothetical protein CPLU01_12781 [Colletotrichum plurivorum]|uniref:Uncharacterized protein n=1 Tax=Colletotrichum plurivorum TaxID=2175906 RepID=A0A8H6JVW3_9PEZI|nr:hypothetical protein CPLU01_12781 [Colletotrichum plurivorum]